MNTYASNFDAHILGCIERALSTYGEDTKIALYYSFKRNYGVTKDVLASSPLQLGACLEHSFGEVGGSIVERLIVREIGRAFGITLLNTSLQDAIKKAKEKFQACEL
jgi:hypothetical protein